MTSLDIDIFYKEKTKNNIVLALPFSGGYRFPLATGSMWPAQVHCLDRSGPGINFLKELFTSEDILNHNTSVHLLGIKTSTGAGLLLTRLDPIKFNEQEASFKTAFKNVDEIDRRSLTTRKNASCWTR